MAVLVTAVGVELVRSGIERIIDPQPVEFGLPVVAVMLLSIAVKTWMMGFNRTIGRRIESETLEATAVDSRNDAISTLTVLACSAASYATNVQLDGWVALGVGAFVLVSGLGLVRDTVNPLLGQAPSEEVVNRVHEIILGKPGVLGMHDLMIHDYGPGRKFGSAHVEMPASGDPVCIHALLDDIEKEVERELGIVLTLHYDPIACDDVRPRPEGRGKLVG